MKRERVIDRSAHRVTEFSSIAEFLKSNEIPTGILTIHSGGLPIDLLVSPALSSTTICFFHGAIDPHFTLPVLSGLGVSGGIEANRVFISDPSLVLNDELMLSWYAGNKYQPNLQRKLTTILKQVLKNLGSDRVVFFGGSGGGFASLFFAHQFENSLALVFNPQTNIERYSVIAVRDYAQRAFLEEAREDAPLSNLPSSVTYDLCDLYKSSTGTQIAYMQNLNDKNHIESHLLPFLRELDPKTEVFLLAQHWRDGHFPPPKEILSRALNLSASSDDWAESFTRLGFNNFTGTDANDEDALLGLLKSEEVPAE